MEQGPIPVQSIPYFAGTSDSWRPVVRLMAYAGILLGCAKAADWGTRIFFGMDRGQSMGLLHTWSGIGLLFYSLADVAATAVLIVGSIACLCRSLLGRKLFLWSTLAIVFLRLIDVSVGVAAGEMLFHQLGINTNVFSLIFYLRMAPQIVEQFLLPLLLWIVMSRPQSHATFAGISVTP